MVRARCCPVRSGCPVRVRVRMWVRRGGDQRLRASPGRSRSLAGAPLSSRSHTQTHTPRLHGSRSAARTHLHFLNEPLDGCQRRGPGAGGREPWRGGPGAGCSERPPRRRRWWCGRASWGGRRVNWAATPSRPGADQADPAARRP